MNRKESFENWLKLKHKDSSGAPSSYIRCIELLSESFYKNKKIDLPSLYQIDDIEIIKQLHEETLKIQKDKNSYLYRSDAPGYGENNFYSASLNNYIQFLEMNNHIEPKQQLKGENVEFTKYFLKFKNSTFDNIKLEYDKIFREIYFTELDWMAPIEQKLHHIKVETDRADVLAVIENLKDVKYIFNINDEKKLSTFSRVIDKTINVSNFINNFTIQNLRNSGISIHDLFNKMKAIDKLEDLKPKVILSGTLLNCLPYYFSAVKHCQAPTLFPIYYKYWYTCLNSVYNIPNDYDALTKFYRTLPLENRHINFCAFWGALGNAILLEIKKEVSITSKESKPYKKLLKLIPSEKYIDEIFELNNKKTIIVKKFNHVNFHEESRLSNYLLDDKISIRFISSLLTKPFVILSGLSGSGKTKLAQAFVYWICESSAQYKIVPVGADWTNREPLLGYPNGLEAEKYITPDSGVIHLLMEASKEENKNKPYFLVLDEMNLSHVERYFADFLSIMESNDSIKLYTGNKRVSLDCLDIDFEIKWPKNLFIIGTVNIDETTYMFSPKVLDRANVIEFRITETEIEKFFEQPSTPNLDNLRAKGAEMASSFLSLAEKAEVNYNKSVTKELVQFFSELKKVGAEFGYRSAAEIMQLIEKLKILEPNINENDCIDIAIMQKLLPKLHGSRSKLVKVLITLASLCIENKSEINFEKDFEELCKKNFEGITIKYPISFEKLIRMYKNVIANGFTSYAEA
jgi:5-methylcytosine-specific restriction protein B